MFVIFFVSKYIRTFKKLEINYWQLSGEHNMRQMHYISKWSEMY